MSILNNAVESIQIGMEDFHDDDPRRVLSTIRNLYAGILLLFKCKLQELSKEGTDEALLKTKIIPTTDPESGELVWIGKGKKTVEVQDIIERLTGLGIKGIEWQRLNTLQGIRNDIEHYYSQAPEEKIKEAIANALHLIMQFCEPHLGRKPVDVLGEECWDLMLSVATVYDAELKACRDNLSSMTWPFEEVAESITFMRCPECDSELLRVVDVQAQRSGIEFLCSSCHSESPYQSVIGNAVSSAMAGRNHWQIKDGGNSVTETCPECNADAFLNEHNECAACFYELEYTECEWCGERLSVEDQYNEGTCDYCQHRYDKMMAE